MRVPARALCFLLAGIACPSAQAESSISVGSVEVHYNAVPSLSLTPQVARQYALTRSAGRGLLNIAVLQTTDGAMPKAIPAQVTASATNLAGQRQDIVMREVREGDAIYYLGEPRISDGDTLVFEFTVDPEGDPAPIDGRFRQEFFAPR